MSSAGRRASPPSGPAPAPPAIPAPARPSGAAPAPAAAPPAGPELDAIQQGCVDAIAEGRNLFVTGPGGTGKSLVLVRATAEILRRRPDARVDVLAPTAIAAALVGGRTVDAYFGFAGGGRPPLPSDVSRALNRARMCSGALPDAIAIDEASMIHGDALDAIDAGLREVTGKRTVPFGGVQFVLLGDFFQLPPHRSNRSILDARAFREGGFETRTLKRVLRQSDPVLGRTLKQVRVGALCPASVRFLRARAAAQAPAEPPPTRIVRHPHEAARENARLLAALPGDGAVYVAEDAGDEGDARVRALLADHRAPRRLELRPGALVMFTDEGRVGTRARVLSVDPRGAEVEGVVGRKRERVEATVFELWTMVCDGPGRPPRRELLGSRRQLPLALAWAISVRDAQGCSFDAVECELNERGPEPFGYAYTALSRVKAPDGIYLRDGTFEPSALEADRAVYAYYRDRGMLEVEFGSGDDEARGCDCDFPATCAIEPEAGEFWFVCARGECAYREGPHALADREE